MALTKTQRSITVLLAVVIAGALIAVQVHAYIR